MSAFHLACQNGHAKIVEMIIQKSSELNIRLNTRAHDLRTPFHFACMEGMEDCFDMTAFHIACLSGQSKIAEIEMLIRKSADFKIYLNARDDCGLTAFHQATLYGNKNIVELFIDNSELFGLNLTIKDDDGKTGFQLT